MQIAHNDPNPIDTAEQAGLDDLMRKKATVNKWIEELEKRASHLPPIDEHGEPVTPGTEDIYAQKDEAVLELKKAVTALEKGASVLNNAITRCHRNLDIIRSDSERLILDDAQDHYLSAEQEQGKQLRKLIERRKNINHVLQRAKLALDIAESKKLPTGMPPRKDAGDGTSESVPTIANTPATPPMRGPGGILPVGPVAGISKSDLGDETGGLLSIGPLR